MQAGYVGGARGRIGFAAATGLLTLVLTWGSAVGAQDCVGDCDGDGRVTVSELIVGVNIALGSVGVEECLALDVDGGGEVSVAELIAAVKNALSECPGAPTTAGIVFNGEGNRLNAYEPSAAFPRQTVIDKASVDPENGRDINGQICFTRGPAGGWRFIAGEDTDRGGGGAPGWGLFELEGATVGEFSAVQIGKLVPTYQESANQPVNYGCAFLGDGRLLTTDIGNQSDGAGSGQLIIWFPPLDGHNARYCKLDVAIGTALSVAVDDRERVYVASARVDPGVFRYTGPFPTADTKEGGCGRVDPTGAPMVEEGLVDKEKFISDASADTAGGLVAKPGGGFYVASVLSGVIAEFDGEGQLVRHVLTPPPGSALPWPTGSPLGLGLAGDGTIYYADVGLVGGPGVPGPGEDMGTVRRIRFVGGEPQPPETLDSGLNFPDGIGVLED